MPVRSWSTFSAASAVRHILLDKMFIFLSGRMRPSLRGSSKSCSMV
jgi:hypothetical protein